MKIYSIQYRRVIQENGVTLIPAETKEEAYDKYSRGEYSPDQEFVSMELLEKDEVLSINETMKE